MKAEKNNKIKSLSMPYHQYFIYFCEGDRRRMNRRVLRVLIRKCTAAREQRQFKCWIVMKEEEKKDAFYSLKRSIEGKKSIFLLLLLPWRESQRMHFFLQRKKIESTPQSETNDRLALVILKNHHKCCCPSGLA